MEAKRRRSEKQRSLRSEKEGGGGGGGRLRREIEQYVGAANWFGLAAAGGGDVGQGFVQRSGSVESQGGSPSGLSESDGKPVQGTTFIFI